MNPRIEEFLENGFITKEAADRLENFEEMLKEAGFLDGLKNLMLSTAKQIGPAAVGSVLGVIGADYLTKKHTAKVQQQQDNKLHASLDSIMLSNPDLNSEKAQQRFSEIAHFSPEVANIPNIAVPLIRRTLDTGLDERDVRNLVQIEAGKRQTMGIAPPRSARMFESLINKGVTSMGQTISAGFDSADVKLNPITEDAFPHIIEFISSRMNIPAEVVSALKAGSNATQEQSATAGRFFEQNPNVVMEAAEKFKLSDQINEINSRYSGLNKQGSADVLGSVTMEKRAEILADQYLLIKHAGIFNAGKNIVSKMGPSLMGLGAAALFGAAGSIVEQSVDFARTEKSNSQIKGSWEETRKRLKQMNTDGSVFSSGIDYSDSENMNKAERAFKVLVDIAPSLAQNATIATPFVNRVVQQDGDITPDVVKQLAETQKNISATRQYRSPFADSPLAQGFGRMFQAAGGPKAVDNAADALSSAAQIELGTNS